MLKSRLRQIAAFVVAGCAMWLSSAPTHAQSNVLYPLTCESQGGAPELCDFKDPVLAAEFVRQLSRTGCGNNIFFTPTGLQVVGGCRAAFNVLVSTSRQAYPLSCSSDRFQPRQCIAPEAIAQGRQIRAAWIVSRESDKPCAQGREFFIEGDRIEVSGGCRANFLYTLE
jgi:hypothetical protein